MTAPNEIIKRQRRTPVVGEKAVCGAAGLSIHEYGDVEAYPSEFLDATSLAQARAICEFLKIDIAALVGAGPSSGPPLASGDIPALLRNARMRKGFTKEQRADTIGYQSWVIERIEIEAGYRQELCLSAQTNIAQLLEIPVESLIGP